MGSSLGEDCLKTNWTTRKRLSEGHTSENFKSKGKATFWGNVLHNCIEMGVLGVIWGVYLELRGRIGMKLVFTLNVYKRSDGSLGYRHNGEDVDIPEAVFREIAEKGLDVLSADMVHFVSEMKDVLAANRIMGVDVASGPDAMTATEYVIDQAKPVAWQVKRRVGLGETTDIVETFEEARALNFPQLNDLTPLYAGEPVMAPELAAEPYLAPTE